MKTCTNTWADFYQGRLNNGYYEYVKDRYEVFIDLIYQTSMTGSMNLLESGCGLGNITRSLHERNNDLLSVIFDNNSEMLKMAQINLAQVAYNLMVISHDIFEPLKLDEKFEVVHGHGVLEHFSDEQINTVITNQKKIGRYIIHYVPSYKYVTPSFGDERLMNKQQWYDICQPDEIIEFNNGYDYILKWGV